MAGPWTLGEAARSDGQTKLHEQLAEAVATIQQKRSIAEVDPTIIMRYPSGCARVLSLQQPKIRKNLVVIVIVGSTGIGKTWSVHDLVAPDDLYTVNYGNGGLWWDGYAGHKAILFDEFKGQVPLQRMLQLLDIYPQRLEIKGGFTPAEYKLVFITSNSMPEFWYPCLDGRDRSAEMQALFRRLGVIIHTNFQNVENARRDIYESVRARLSAYYDVLSAAGIQLGRGFAAGEEPLPLIDVQDLPEVPEPPTEPLDDPNVDDILAAQPIMIPDDDYETELADPDALAAMW